MPSDKTVAEYAIQMAKNELRRGKRQSARSWALKAISVSPEMEEPWLIMAELASPVGRLSYFRQALKLNPASQRARQGLDKALQQAEKTGRSRELSSPSPETGLFQPLQPPTITSDGQYEPATAQTLASDAVPGSKKAPQKSLLRYKRRLGLVLIAPWLLGLLIFKLAPILATVGFSFTNSGLLDPGQFSFVGLKNYFDLFKDPVVGAAFLGSFKLAGIVIPIQVAAAILLASILNDKRLRMQNTLRVLFFLPSIIPSLSALFMWEGFVDPNSGWLNRLILDPLNLPKYLHLPIYGSTDPSMLILATLWSIGPGFLIILGAMQGIPTDIYEAAMVDGASRLRRFFSMTIPLVTPAIFFTMILNLIAVFGGSVLLDRGDTFNASHSSVDALLYYTIFDAFRLGSAASLAWVFFILMLIIVIALFITSKYWVYFPDREG
jgi:ABC-type sugar transport system permease subunit